MPAMGPSVNENQAKEAFEEVWKFLQDKYRIQTLPLMKHPLPNEQPLRDERKEALRLAIRGLLELEAWESF